ncbi:MAG: hypothetical protein ACJ798_08965 [Phenylobacterium sp.]
MSFASDTETPTAVGAEPGTLLTVPVGLASPLWGIFAAAALGGSAWWWMTRLARPENLEALFGAAAGPALSAPERPAVADAISEPSAVVEPVGGEAAPIAPAAGLQAVVDVSDTADAAEAAPKPRTPKAEPKAD